jgi:hypothetical protein
VSGAEAELRRVRARLREAESGLEAARRITREGRTLEDVRLRLLLDTVVEAGERPAPRAGASANDHPPRDLVEGAETVAAEGAPERALLSDDPALLDQLLACRRCTWWSTATTSPWPATPTCRWRPSGPAGQRAAALAARSGAEVTCCFDGATVAGRVPPMSTRGVRVLFSKPGEIADELIRRLVRAEPEGRPVVVVSSDREVADGVRRSGARPVSAAALVRRLDRG